MEAWQIVASIISLGVSGGIGAWLLKVWQQRRGYQVEDRNDAWSKQAILIDRLDKQLITVQAEQQRSRNAEAICEQKVARLTALGQWLYTLLKEQHDFIVNSGGKIGPIPAFPDFDSESSSVIKVEKEFNQRTTEHVSGLLHDDVRAHKEESQ